MKDRDFAFISVTLLALFVLYTIGSAHKSHEARITTIERQIADLRQERITRALPESKEIKFTAP